MEFTMQPNPMLPRLAWCARLEQGSSTVTVEHGPWVESQPDLFFEGAWAGKFDADGLTEAEAVLGSGAFLSGDSVTFVPGTHTMERLHTCRDGDVLLVSNSFAYLLTALGDGVDPRHVTYESDFLSVLHGYHKARATVPTRDGRRVGLHYYLRLHIDRRLNVRTALPPRSARFSDYDGYVQHLQRIAKQVVDNAQDGRRSVRYQPLATVSTGYDSPACAVIARDCGCTEAVTFVSARMEHNGSNDPSDSDDAGGAIAQQLGLNVTEYERARYMERDDAPEAEFLATGSGGDDVVMSVLEDRLPGTVFFTGFRGDTIWGLEEQDPKDSARFKTKDPSGASLGEFRLRLGFIHLPLPALCMPYHEQVLRISKSPEMAPWRLGNEYDRPIPRRLVESAGVAREAFGQEKKAITQPFWVTRDNVSMFCDSSRTALLGYSKQQELRNRQSLAYRLQCAWASAYLSLIWRADRLSEKLPVRIPVRYPIALRNLVSTTGYKFHWAVNKVCDRYGSAQRSQAASRLQTSMIDTTQPDVRK